MNRMQEQYQKEIAPALFKSFEFKNVMQVPRIEKVIVNIGSGAGRHPYDGWGAYCSSKAAIDMLSEVGDMENNLRKNGFRIVSLAPGPVDTDMQEVVRSTAIEDFSQIPKFIALKESGQLPGIEETAEKILSLISRIDQYEGSIQDIRKIPFNP